MHGGVIDANGTEVFNKTDHSGTIYFHAVAAQGGDMFGGGDGKYSGTAVEFHHFPAAGGGDVLHALFYQHFSYCAVGLEKTCRRYGEFAEAPQIFREQPVAVIFFAGKADHILITCGTQGNGGAAWVQHGVFFEVTVYFLLCQQALFYGDDRAVVGGDITVFAISCGVEFKFVPGAQPPGRGADGGDALR